MYIPISNQSIGTTNGEKTVRCRARRDEHPCHPGKPHAYARLPADNPGKYSIISACARSALPDVPYAGETRWR